VRRGCDLLAFLVGGRSGRRRLLGLFDGRRVCIAQRKVSDWPQANPGMAQPYQADNKCVRESEVPSMAAHRLS
jgi:hypothetical protein